MTDLHAELETLGKELTDLLNARPIFSHFKDFIDFDYALRVNHCAIMSKQEMIIGIQKLIIRQLESNVKNC